MKSTGQSYTDGNQSMGGSLEEKYSNIPDEPTTTVWYKNKWVWIGTGVGLLAIGVTLFFVLKGKKTKK